MPHHLEVGSRLVVASHNPGKAWEIQQLIAPYGLEAISAATLKLAEPEETETTFAGNARLKAVAAARASGMPALADDSGLQVEVLSGAPGIYSARWAGPRKDFSVAMQRVADEVSMRGGWERAGPRANFISVLCLAWPDGDNEVFEGKVFGHLVWPPRGGNGFGYDPMFRPDDAEQTFGEMQPEDKYAVSHRTRAFAAFKAKCLAGLSRRKTQPSRDEALAGLQAAAANLSTQSELAVFVAKLAADAAAHPDADESVAPMLRRIVAWLNSNELDGETSWRLVAKALLEATKRS
ncbi:MAG: RdgB/HAM1 family non-canonical purine NTP pyrophosphatase [Hyphomicrobiaceae bacterium]|nr:RdgB/HAM1 family non-canonical purine NTP pyrophosphatase [Hyphomicrobiaceae bacterium]MCC0009294.1 RdgB/HAM1 family non-canonical purine NTP pyrophosphatase [Hyphomicrobiaceae bacterium]